jgi:hypothetical protein
MHILTDKQYNELMAEWFMKGYDAGYESGKEEGLHMRYTLNELRAAFGLKPINKEDI